MANPKPTKTSFNKDKQPTTRKPRGKSERTKILESFKRLNKTENGFYDLLTTKAFDQEDNFSFKELLARMSPISKAVNPLINFEFNSKAKPHEQAAQVMAAVARGEVPSDVGGAFIASISAMLNIQEKTDFEDRLKAIENASK